jgi:hypothetical protein
MSTFWAAFLNLYYFIVSYSKILRFWRTKIFDLRLFRVVLRLSGIKKFLFLKIIYDPFIFANNRFSEILSINIGRDGFKCQSWAKIFP